MAFHLFAKKDRPIERLNYGEPSAFKKKLDERSFVLKESHCPSCRAPVTVDELAKTFFVCAGCGHHFRLNAIERIRLVADPGSFEEVDSDLASRNPLGFPAYDDKLAEARRKTGLHEAIVTGTCRIDGVEVVAAVMDFYFMGGSMGSVVGEKMARALALGAVKGLPFFVVLTDPTTGGLEASFAMLGDVILAEPNALVGFAGARVIEGTLGQKLPDDFQKAEFQLKKGFVDAIVERRDLKATLAFLLRAHGAAPGAPMGADPAAKKGGR